MPIPYYLAMTAAEFFRTDPLPQQMAWMACHFSPYATGLSNCPQQLPKGSLLILNDRTPVCGHDPQRIARQLHQLVFQHHCSGILLDLQRPDAAEIKAIVQAVCQDPPCPVGVSENYWEQDLGCAVFLEPPPLHIPPADYLAPWKNHTVWMEAAAETRVYSVTEGGCRITAASAPPQALPHWDERCFCRYGITRTEDALQFTLHRGKAEWEALIASGPEIALFVGLYQQMK